MMMVRRLLLTVFAVGLGLSSAACTKTSTCSRDADLVVVTSKEGIRHGNTYLSGPVGGPYQYFPPLRTISFEHGLKGTPYAVQFWVTFSPKGTLAPAAGNMAELRGPDNDDESALNERRIAVHNDTCSDFYLWVVAQLPAVEAPDGGADLADAGP